MVQAAGEIWSAGRDASLQRSETLADQRGDRQTAASIHRARLDLGGLDSTELPIRNYDGLTASVAMRRIARLTNADDVRAILAYETANKERKGVINSATAGSSPSQQSWPPPPERTGALQAGDGVWLPAGGRRSLVWRADVGRSAMRRRRRWPWRRSPRSSAGQQGRRRRDVAGVHDEMPTITDLGEEAVRQPVRADGRALVRRADSQRPWRGAPGVVKGQPAPGCNVAGLLLEVRLGLVLEDRWREWCRGRCHGRLRLPTRLPGFLNGPRNVASPASTRRATTVSALASSTRRDRRGSRRAKPLVGTISSSPPARVFCAPVAPLVLVRICPTGQFLTRTSRHSLRSLRFKSASA